MRRVPFLFCAVLVSFSAARADDTGHIGITETSGSRLAIAQVAAVPRLFTPAHPTSVVAPGWPSPDPASQRRRRVVLAYNVEADGRVSGVRVLESGGSDYDQNSVEALQQWVYSPATTNDHPVAEANREIAFDFRP